MASHIHLVFGQCMHGVSSPPTASKQCLFAIFSGKLEEATSRGRSLRWKPEGEKDRESDNAAAN